jgi:hypothetical protein
MHRHKARKLTTILGLAVLLVLSACGDNTSFIPGDGDGQQSTTSAEGTQPTPAPGEETTTTEPPPTEAPTTTAETPPSGTAADALAAFFAAAESLDTQIADAAVAFNAGWDESAMTMSAAGEAAVNALDAGPVAELIPAGLSPNLERAVLAVYADLDSRIAAMQGSINHMFPGEHDLVIHCLIDNGQTSFQRFDADLTAAKNLAASEPFPTAAPDSEAAGILAVRIAAIHSMNFGCDACGGLQYDAHIPVDWPGRTVSGVNFDAAFAGGEWVIVIYAC